MSFVPFLFLSLHADPELIPIEAGVEDENAHSTSLKLVQQDLRVDMSFEKLYRIAGKDGVYARKSGGLTAVFQNPEYYKTQHGVVPLVPAGTVYCIGEIPSDVSEQLAELQGEQPKPESLIEPVEAETTSSRSVRPQIETPKEKSFLFVDNEAYRRKRMTALVLSLVLTSP